MSRLTREVTDARKRALHTPENAVTNFMGGTSYTLDPLETLKLVTASSIFGEPQYYRDGAFVPATVKDGLSGCASIFLDYLILDRDLYRGKDTSEVMEEVIDRALDYDFAAVLDWAVTLRREYYMRLNPQVIMVRAASHPKRAAYTEAHPGKFAAINDLVMKRADEPASQLTYYLYKNGLKNDLPGLLKRSWAKRLEKMSARDIYKYRNAGIGMIDTVRICHANSPLIDELMRTGTVAVPEAEKTWESLRARGCSWREILSTVQLGHMALLRNLRNIFTEINDFAYARTLMEQLKSGVKGGMQFPFRYKTAYDLIKGTDKLNHKQLILDTLEECIDIACENMPKLPGRTCCLSDNSGSAWGTFTSEYGSVHIADIDNLSSVIAARNSDEGYVGKFGNELHMIPVSHRDGVLGMTEKIGSGYPVGGATENGVWLFFDKAITEKEHWDNIFIYSDMQAGHGDLYGTEESADKYRALGYAAADRNNYLDVAKLVDVYRKTVNPKVNVYCVQTAGYDNILLPENGYRTALLYGWTGKELVYADAVNRFWDEFDRRHAES